jgi:hypothetical protein
MLVFDQPGELSEEGPAAYAAGPFCLAIDLVGEIEEVVRQTRKVQAGKVQIADGGCGDEAHNHCRQEEQAYAGADFIGTGTGLQIIGKTKVFVTSRRHYNHPFRRDFLV